VRGWWDEFDRWPEQQQRAATAPLQNKLGALLASWPLRNILCQVRNKLEVGEVFQGRILVVELTAAHLGSKEAVKLFGSLLLYDLMHAGLKHEAYDAPRCFVYLPNAAAFSPEVLEELVAGAETSVSVALATTHLSRLESRLEQALMSACGAILASRSSYVDAEAMYKHFGELRMKEREFVSMGWNELAVKLPTGRPYWTTVDVFPHQQFAHYGKALSVISRSLDRFGTPRTKVERKIRAWQHRWMAAAPHAPTPPKWSR
jgi:hypothetical protein